MHDDDSEHDHSLDWLEAAPGEDIEGLEQFTLQSVGIDIGSSTMHLIFSRLTLRRHGAGLSARFIVADREEIYRSPIMLTPYLTPTRIDAAQVTTFVDDIYSNAGLLPEEVDTGAVVITGEALKKENAAPILEYFAREGGRFICASAGPMHEALLAAHGSGAIAISRSHNNLVLNVDIGGGTTKVTMINAGRIVRMLAFEVGARIVAFDTDMRLTRIERPAETVMAALGSQLALGERITEDDCRAMAERMTAVLFDIVEGRMTDPLSDALLLTGSLADIDTTSVDHIVFSGGVSEYIYAADAPRFGDLGPWLGASIRARAEATLRPGTVIRPIEGIRATVVGAGEYTLQASGATSYISDPAILPLRGIQVIHAAVDRSDSGGEISSAIAGALAKYDANRLDSRLALALSVTGQPDYGYIRRIADGIAHNLAPACEAEILFIIIDADIAKSIGAVLSEELRVSTRIIVVDGIEVGDLDYVDLGSPMGGTEVIPVTVKSLVFGIRSKSG